MFNTKNNSQLIKYIVLFGNHIAEEDYPTHILEEFKERHIFCLKELKFWRGRNNHERYRQALRELLNWVVDVVEENF